VQGIDDWAAVTRRAFANGIPNGWTLGWDRTRFEKEIVGLAKPWKCFNSTSFDYARCNKYEIEFKERPDSYYVLTILVSFVVNAYVAFWTHYTEGGRSGVVDRRPKNQTRAAVEDAIISILENRSFKEMPDDIYRAKIEGIPLELSEPGDVTIGKCCFEDFDG
jgi:hypothetical protein